MESAVKRELVVASDPAAAAAELFLATAPRTISLAGGSTPKALYELLARQPYAWQTVDVFFGDERCVARDHPDSNFHMANLTLLSKVPARVHPMPGESCGAEAYEAELSSVFGAGVPEIDLVLLGLGADGHTASLFPGDPALEEQTKRVLRVERPDHSRLTLTLPVLSAAKLVVFLVAGAEKAGPLKLLMEDGDIPAARVQAQRVVVIADEAAAGR